MRIFPYIACLAVLGLAGVAYNVTSQHQTVMAMAVKVSGGQSGADGSIAADVGASSVQQKEARDARDSAEKDTGVVHHELNREGGAIEQRKQKEDERDTAISARDKQKQSLEATKEDHAKAQEEADAMLATMKELDALADAADLSEVVETFTTAVSDAKTKQTEELIPELESLVTARTAATEKVAAETTELARLEKINADFEANYRKNETEYVVAAIDPARNIVTFIVTKDSGVVAGDTTPLLVKRGKNTVATLRVESIKENKVVAKYSLAPGQRIQPGDRIIHVKPHGS